MALFLLSMLMMGILFRWHGGGFFSAPRMLRNILCALPFCLTPLFLCPDWQAYFLSALSFGIAMLGISTGHGRGQSLKQPLIGSPEKIELLILWSWPYLTTYEYKCLILFMTSLLIASGSIFVFIYEGSYLSAFLCLIGAAMKPISYMIGWEIYPNENGPGIKNFNQATEIGEFITGAFMGGFLFAAIEVS